MNWYTTAMYVRWTHRTRVHGGLFGDAGQVRWKASLIESVRVDGKPRQRHIALLGSFRDSDIENPNYGHRSRCDFWDTVTARLDRLGDRVSAEEPRKIEDAIARKVKPPTQRIG